MKDMCVYTKIHAYMYMHMYIHRREEYSQIKDRHVTTKCNFDPTLDLGRKIHTYRVILRMNCTHHTHTPIHTHTHKHTCEHTIIYIHTHKHKYIQQIHTDIAIKDIIGTTNKF